MEKYNTLISPITLEYLIDTNEVIQILKITDFHKEFGLIIYGQYICDLLNNKIPKILNLKIKKNVDLTDNDKLINICLKLHIFFKELDKLLEPYITICKKQINNNMICKENNTKIDFVNNQYDDFTLYYTNFIAINICINFEQKSKLIIDNLCYDIETSKLYSEKNSGYALNDIFDYLVK